MQQPFMSFRLRLTLWNVGIMALLLLALGIIIRFTTQAAIGASMDRQLEARAKTSVEHWQRFDRDRMYPPPWYRPGQRRPRPAPDASNAFVRFWPRTLDVTGSPYLPWADDRPWDWFSVPKSASGQTVSTSVWAGREHIRVRSLPLTYDGKVVGVMQIASSLANMDQALAGLTITMLALVPLMLIACGLAAANITGRALRPIRSMAQASGRIGAGNLSERLPITGNDEIAELAQTINGMLGRLDHAFTQLEHSFQQQRRFAADASHELRTPLTAIKGNVSLALAADRTAEEYRAALEDTNRATDIMHEIVQELLFLARSDANQLRMEVRPIDVHELLQSSVDAVQGIERPTVVIETPDHLPPLCGDPNLLMRAIVNLLVNALKHTLLNGAISLSASVEGDKYLITVTDTGEGIPPEHLPHLTERFYRADASRARTQGGTGLGLAICRCIAEAHGGTLTFVSAVGVGTIVTLGLPFTPLLQVEGG